MGDRTTPFGAEAYAALVLAVRDAKAGDPLRPVTVLVPSERVGVAARRALARGDGRPGIAAVSVLTVRRLAESLAAGELTGEGRRPLTTMTLAAGVRHVLGADPGVFAPVAGQVGTVRALARAHRELRAVTDPERVAGDDRVPAATVSLHRGLTRHLASTTFDEFDLLRRAARRAGELTDPVVAFLLRDPDPAEAVLLGAVSDLIRVDGIDGGDGIDGIDGGGATPYADRVVHASDPDDEVRAAVREVTGALREGVPGHRIAVLFGAADPYARLLHEHLHRAGVTFSGRGIRSTLDGPHGRGLLRMLALPDHGLRRDEVLAWLTDCPIRFRGGRVPASRWERISRAAGVVRDGTWDRLLRYAGQRRERAPELAEDALVLHEFVTHLRDGLEAITAATGWAELAVATRSLWDEVTGGDDRVPARIGSALEAVAHLPGDGDLATLRELLELHLADDLDRVGTIGVGVQLGPVSDGWGADVDRVLILGAAEGILPARAPDDPLLPDRVRARSGGALPTSAELIARRRREFHAALSAAPPGGRTVSFPRGDLRGGRARVPSRWLLPTLRSVSGDASVTVAGWEKAGGTIELPSHVGALLGAVPATAQEWRQCEAVAHAATSDGLATALAGRRRERSRPALTAQTGRVSGAPDPTAAGARALSATDLQAWASCPYAYFVTSVLGARAVESPEDVVRISPTDRGTLVHGALEDLVRRAVEEGWVPDADSPWPEGTWEHLETAARARCEAAEADGRTGFPLLWQEDRAALLADLQHWLTEDDRRRREHGGLVAAEAEWSFGRDGEPAVALEFGDGRSLSLKGKVDRIDRARDGTLVVVDYKTGRPVGVDQVTWGGGTQLQLPIYALAVAAHFPVPPQRPVRAMYWYTSRRWRFDEEWVDLDDATHASAASTIAAIVDGMAAGVFPARVTASGRYFQGRSTARPSCVVCEPDGLGEVVPLSHEQLADDPGLRELASVHRLWFGESA